MVQHGLEHVKSIIAKVHETVDFLNSSEAQLKRFGELVSQYNVQERKLVLECKTRWNSTYDMLDCAIKFRKVFPRYALHDHNYGYCPNDDEWEKIEKLLQVLKVFKDTTNIISGSEYPSSNVTPRFQVRLEWWIRIEFGARDYILDSLHVFFFRAELVSVGIQTISIITKIIYIHKITTTGVVSINIYTHKLSLIYIYKNCTFTFTNQSAGHTVMNPY